LASAAVADEAPVVRQGDQLVADFDTLPGLPTGQNLQAAVEPDPAGGRSLHVVPAPAPLGKDKLRALIFTLPPGLDPGAASGVSVKLRGPADAKEAVPLRWIGLDEKGRRILQRRFELKPAPGRQDVTLPWVQWRWGETSAGGPAEVRKLALLIERQPPDLWVDDLRLVSAAGATSPSDWLRRLAFGDHDARVAEADGLMVATDAVGGLTEADLTRILARMRAARAFVRRVFGQAVRPIDPRGVPPAALLIFRDRQGQSDFFRRLGKAWAVSILPPTSDGYTVQDIATSTDDPRQGADRPVFLHESLHAVLARDVRLLIHHERHAWLHEGMASYLQVCLYPQTMDERELAARFPRPIDPDAVGGAFKPLGRLMSVRPSMKEYPQLASLVAFLMEKKPGALEAMALEMTLGGGPEDALTKRGSSLAELQAEWLEWGKARFAGAPPARGAKPPFDVPEEFKPTAAGSVRGRR